MDHHADIDRVAQRVLPVDRVLPRHGKRCREVLVVILNETSAYRRHQGPAGGRQKCAVHSHIAESGVGNGDRDIVLKSGVDGPVVVVGVVGMGHVEGIKKRFGTVTPEEVAGVLK